METIDKILRYEMKLERQLYRALSQLERVQRLRRGEDGDGAADGGGVGRSVNEK